MMDLARIRSMTLWLGVLALAAACAWRQTDVLLGTALGVAISFLNLTAMERGLARDVVRPLSLRYVALLATMAAAAYFLPISATALVLGYLVFIPASVIVLVRADMENANG